ncbi:MAG: hypothetical protein LBR47_03015 [Spirochaetaceae bacterium]|nr:hypothetical protein [Spirochaetaceae bacterium]
MQNSESANRRFVAISTTNRLFPLWIGLFAALFLFSCATGGRRETPVNIFDYFSDDFDIYVTIPVRGNEELILTLAEKLSPGTEVQPLLSRITVLHAAFNIPEGDSSKREPLPPGESPPWELAAEGRFPRSFAGMVLNRRNGWIKNTDSSGSVWYDSVQGEMQIAIPDSSVVLAAGKGRTFGRDIETLLRGFASPEPQQWPPSPAALMDSNNPTVIPQELAPLPAEQAQPAHSSTPFTGGAVRFYLAGPERMMNRFLGNDIRFPVTAIDGALFPGEDSGGGTYLVNLRVYMGESRVVRPAAALFLLLLQRSFPDVTLETGEGNVLYIRGLKLGAGKIAEMIGGVI